METPTLTLSEFLLARYAEEDAVARDAGVRVGLPYESSLYVVDDDYRHDQVGIYPERVLAECEAKRRIMSLPIGNRTEHDLLLRAMALPYTDHPDYRDEWRP